MMMRKTFLLHVILCSLFVFFSCGGAQNEAYSSGDYESAKQARAFGGNTFLADTAMPAEMNAKAFAVPEAASPLGQIPTDRKLVMTTHLSIRVDDLNKSAEIITAMMKNYNAYSSSTQIEENSQTYTIRVPADSYEAMINQANGLGKISSRSDFAEDVTLQYYDLEGRLNMRQELLKTYQSYLAQAENIEEIMSVEKKIAELQNEIDMYGSQFSVLNNQVDYATIILTVYGTESGYSYEQPSIWDRIKDLFGGYSDFLSSAAIVIIQIIVYGIPILIAAALLFWLLFGKIGLMRKLWQLVAKKKS
jgi:hypothetical protein